MKHVEVEKGRFRAVAFAPDGRYLVSLHDGGYVRFWETPDFALRLTVKLSVIPSAAHRLTPAGRRLLTPGCLYDLGPAWDRLAAPEQSKNPAVARLDLQGVGPFHDRLLAAWESRPAVLGMTAGHAVHAERMDLGLWNLDGGALGSWTVPSSGSFSQWEDLAVSPDGRLLAVADGFRVKLTALDLVFAGRPAPPTDLTHTDTVRRLCFSPDGRFLAAGAGRSPWLWDLSGARRPARFPAFRWAVSRLAFHPRGGLFAASSWGGDVRVYDAAAGKEVMRMSHPELGEVRGLAFAPDGMTAVAAGHVNRLVVWDVD